MMNRYERRLIYFSAPAAVSSLPAPVESPSPERLAIAICPQTGSGSLSISHGLAGFLQARTPSQQPPWRVFSRGLIAKVLEDHHLPLRLAKFFPEDARSEVDDILDELVGLHPPSWLIIKQTVETITNLVQEGNVILVGWGANVIANRIPHVFHVRLVGSLERRVARIQQREHLAAEPALALVRQSDRARARYLKRHFGHEVTDELLYDLTVNTDRLSEAETIRLVGDAVLSRQPATEDKVRAQPNLQTHFSSPAGP